jgi:hypothetical protein
MKFMNVREWIGAACTIIGSFLPWEIYGDFSYAINGIRIQIPILKYWISGLHKLIFEDNGGVLIVLLTLIVVLLSLRPPRFVKKPIFWKLITSEFLMASSLFFVGRWLLRLLQARGAMIDIGLLLVVVGSVLLLWVSIVAYRQTNKKEHKVAADIRSLHD